MENEAYNILMLEDDEMDARLIQMYLKNSNLTFTATVVSSRKEFVKALENDNYDVILSDHNLPQFSSLEALHVRNEKKMHIPFILVSGKIPEEYAVTLLKEGANDYVLKDRPNRLPMAIVEAVKKQKVIAEKLKAEEELRSNIERWKLVGEATADAVWDWEPGTSVVFKGEGFSTLFGHKTLVGNIHIDDWKNFIYPEDRHRVVSGLYEAVNNPLKFHWRDEYRYERADGTLAMVLDKGIILRRENGEAYRMVGAMQDITLVRQLEKQLMEEKLDRQQEITEITIHAQEKERTEIGRELHDNVNQLLASAKMMIEAGLRSIEMHDICMSKSIEALSAAISEVRNISHRMVTPSFDDEQFVLAVKEIADNISLGGQVIINLDMSGKDLEGISGDMKLTIFRVIQEQLTNIQKHADASVVDLVFVREPEKLEILIKDNGKGFDPSSRKTGIGLSNIRNRVEMLNGKIDISSFPNEGCVLKITFGLPENEDTPGPVD